MSVLKGFLQPSPMGETKEVIISERFKGEDGKPLPFTIRVIDQDINDRIYKASTKNRKMNGQTIRELDSLEYGRRLILNCVTSPDFKDKELCDFYKCIDPLDVPGKMLSAGEYQRLVKAINELNGFDDDEKLSDDAKNS